MTDVLPLSTEEILITPGLEEAEGFGPLPLQNLIWRREVLFDVYLKTKKKGQEKPQFIKCCARGEAIQEQWYRKLARLEISCVYFAMPEMERVLQYLHLNLELALADGAPSDLAKGVQVCDTLHMWTLNFFNKRSAEALRQGLAILEKLFAVIQGDEDNLLYLLKIKRHKSLALYNHCLNVCLLGLAFTRYLGWSREKVLGFGLGALIHDIGLMRVPQAILGKRGALTKEEMLEIKQHPLDGFRMVQNFVNLRWEALQMVLQHHENGDGSGYPKCLKTPTIHAWARILRILDSYEAMTAERPWRPAMEPKEALWIMYRDWEKSRLFDQHYLMNFIKFLAGK
ncbi:MAG: HD domain-containing phosphohydrolase [Thermodesulfobacteriota bacterium]